MGRTFQESLQKALRGLETGIDGFSERTQRPRGDRPGDRRGRARAHPVRRRRVPHRHERWTRSSRRRAIDPWFLAQIEEIVATEQRAAQAARSRACRRDELRYLKAKGFSDRRLARLLRRRRGRRCARSATRSACARSTSASTPAPPSSRRRPPTCTRPTTRSARPTPTDTQEDHGAGRRPEPDRPGHRVRLLLRPRRARDARGRLRDHHGQLQSGDRVDRLRHLRPPVLRAGDARGRARDRRHGKAASA